MGPSAAERDLDGGVTRAHCRECGCVGPLLQLPAGATVSPLRLAALPRCGCLFRAHTARPVAALTALLASSTLPNDLLERCGATRLMDGHRGPSRITNTQLAILEADAICTVEAAGAPGQILRAVLSVDSLKETLDSNGSRELMVYQMACCEEALLGSLLITADLTICEVLRMLRDVLDVSATAISRGSHGSDLTVPIQRGQHHKPALPFFPSSKHHLIVTEAEPDEEMGDRG